MSWGKIELGASFLLVVAMALYWDSQGIVPLALLACGFHELGHLVALKLLGGRLLRLRLTGVGAEMIVGGGLSDWGQLVLALSGPLANLTLAVGYAYYQISDLFSGLNLALCILNLLPVSGLDGGRAIYALGVIFWGEELAEGFSDLLNWVCTLILLVAGVGVLASGGSFTLLILAVWVGWTQKTWKLGKKTLA